MVFIPRMPRSYFLNFRSHCEDVKKKMFYGANRLIFENAKYLRNHVTNVEMIFWGRLKERFFNHKFRRQHPLSNYIADFYCHKLKLVVELDGSIHHIRDVQQRDKERETIIKSFGIHVIRFTNDDIKLRIESCLEIIESFIQGSTSRGGSLLPL